MNVEELRKMASKFLLEALILTMIIVFSTIVSGEDSSITMPLEDGETYHSILPISGETANPYRLAVIGDSVAWGNGLNQEHKYYDLVAEWLRTNIRKPVEIIVYAHSGAVISGASGESVKNANLNSGYPSLMDQAKNVPNNIDLILVSGGINDVGIANILDPKTSEDTIKSRSENIQEPMKELLMYLVDNTKPDAKIIVTGYYPLITDDSKLGLKDRAASAILARGSEESVSQELINLAAGEANPTLGSAVSTWQSAKEFGINLENIIENDPLFKVNSYTFYSTSSDSLRAAVIDVNTAIGGNRVAFVNPLFQSNNGYRASESYLWEFKSGASIESNDEQYNERSKLTTPLDFENKDNALGHPNVKGASRYADFINDTLKSKISNWFQSATATKEPTSAAVDALSAGSVASDNSVTSTDNQPSHFADDFSRDTGLWSYGGNAYRDAQNGYIVLTSNETLKVGTIWLNQNITSPFTVEYRYKAGGGTGADGLTFMFYKDKNYEPGRGGRLGFIPESSEVAPGYGIEFDNYENSEYKDPNERHIALIKDSVANHLRSVGDQRTEDNQWHQVKVEVNTRSIIVYVDGDQIIKFEGDIDRSYGGLGFSAATWSYNNWHLIDDVRIST